jgi:hypothetical protein
MANYGIYTRLGYNFDDTNLGIINLSDEAKAHLNSTPDLMKDWQKRDIADSNTSGYVKNPMADLYSSMYIHCNTMYNIANNDPANTWVSYAAANTILAGTSNLMIYLNLFKRHTDNISGVADMTQGGSMASQFPYKKTAAGIGKLLTYITHESDGIMNASPILGHFTSFFIPDQLAANNVILASDNVIVNIAASSGTCTLTPAQANTISTHLTNANTLIETRRNHDINFFRNSLGVIADYGKTQEFANLGEVEHNLANNYIGTDKLLSRINS